MVLRNAMEKRSLGQRTRNIVLYWLPLILWMAVIYWLSAQPKLPHPARKLGLSDYLFDYSAHAFTFGFLAILAWRVITVYPSVLPNALVSSPSLSTAAFAATYALCDEIHQIFVPGRWATLRDWLADLVGILMAVGLLILWHRRRLTANAFRRGI